MLTQGRDGPNISYRRGHELRHIVEVFRAQGMESAVDTDTGRGAVVDRRGRVEIKTKRDGEDLIVGEGAISRQILQMLRRHPGR